MMQQATWAAKKRFYFSNISNSTEDCSLLFSQLCATYGRLEQGVSSRSSLITAAYNS